MRVCVYVYLYLHIQFFVLGAMPLVCSLFPRVTMLAVRRKGDGHHRLGYRHPANTDAWVMPAFGDNIDIRTIEIDRSARRQDGTGRLDGKTYHQLLAGGNAACDAPCVIGGELG